MLVRVAAGDHVLGRRRNQDVAIGNDQLLAGHGFRAAESQNRVVAVLEFQQLVDVDAVGIEQPAVLLGDADDLVAVLHHQAGGVRAHVAEALDDHPAAVDGHLQVAQALVADHHHAAAGGFNPPARAADVERLARHHAGHRLPHVHGVGVHDPRHGLLVGVHVGRGHILLRPDELDDLRGVPARHALQFALAHLLRVADHAALGAAKGDVHHRAFPRHPTGQRAHFVQGQSGA